MDSRNQTNPLRKIVKIVAILMVIIFVQIHIFEKTHTIGFISAFEFVFVAVRIVLNVLERRKKDKITAELKPNLYTFI
jgi:preprotein translocase subunit SecG